MMALLQGIIIKEIFYR